MGSYNEQMLAIAGRQHQVVSRAQLLDIGTRRQLEHRLQSGMLERVYDSVYRLKGSPETWRQKLMAATFAGGKLSVASFRAAAALHYLPGGKEIMEITSSRHRRARHVGVYPHESKFLTDLDVMYIDNVPVTRTARTINDLGWLVEQSRMKPQVLDHAMHDAVRRSIVDVERVVREWERLGGTFRAGGKAVETMLRNFVPPKRNPDSSAEIVLLQLLRDAGFPDPVPQWRVWISPTKWYDLDFAWPWLKRFAEFNSYKYHGNWDKHERDALRLLLIRDLGWDGVTVTDTELDKGAPNALRVLRKMLRRAS
ncbi:MAG TPA: type IV toxin-antitoxin system AbiEi family antitoxin domain-containing protein [Acidimicrobiia bacterium]|nr:type IV toxin-antitoxin system AbiEi family antitoxin domain-containing protein [Acidimicrobiia bacterium]